jgi:sodium-independent sulfate anion transporter 11
LVLGFVIDFISEPVITGFKSAVAIIVASGQAKNIFGLEIKPNFNGTKTKSILGTWMKVFENFDSVRINDTILGFSCIIILLCMRVSNFIFEF